jgi:hypothetical protein
LFIDAYKLNEVSQYYILGLTHQKPKTSIALAPPFFRVRTVKVPCFVEAVAQQLRSLHEFGVKETLA